MLDIGGWEFLLIIVLAVVIIGPKELPGAIRTVTLWVRKARGLAREFQSGLDDIVREAELDKLRDEVTSGIDPTGTVGSLKQEIEGAVDPEGEIAEAFQYDDREDWYSDHEEEAEHAIAAPDERPESETEEQKSADTDVETRADTGSRA